MNVIDGFFTDGFSLVCLEGKPDIGKSSLLKQFALRHSKDSVSFFLQPHSWFLQDPSLFYAEMAAQLSGALGRTGHSQTNGVDEAGVRRLLLDVHRQPRKRNEFFYLIVDGMEDVLDQAGPLISALVGVLPFEFSTFRFVFSGDLQWLPANALSRLRYKTYPVPGFSLEETLRYFSEFAIETSEVDELYRSLSNGTPGHLASARRLLETGMEAPSLIDQLHTHLPNPFRLEWTSLTPLTEPALEALAVLAFDPTPHSATELAEIVGVPVEEMHRFVDSTSFLTELDSKEPVIRFVSASFRNFVGVELQQRRAKVWDKLATHFLHLRETDRAASVLPLYLEQSERPNDLLSLLDSATFVRLASSSDSLNPLLERSLIGFDAAMQLKKYGDTIRFGIQFGIVSEISPLTSVKAEIHAKLHLGDYASAIDQAQTTVLRSHRLQLLASIVKFQKTRGLTAEGAVLDAIKNLAEQVTDAELGEELLETAGDLMFTSPEIAIRLISRASENRSDDRALDWELAKLSALATKIPSPSGSVGIDLGADIRSRISNPDAKNFSSAITLLVEDLPINDVLKQAKTFGSAGDQIFFLRQWCRNTRKPESAAAVIDYAVYLSIRTTEYTPTARDYRDLAVPLPKIADSNLRRSLITAFDIQKESVRSVGPTQDFIQTQMLLAEAEARDSITQAGQRLVEAYYQLGAIKDLEIKAVCLALIVAAIPQITCSSVSSEIQELHHVCESELQESIDILLGSSADHYEMTTLIIDALTPSRSDLAIAIIDKLNYESRRESARIDVALGLLDRESSSLDFQRIASLLGSFADAELEDYFVWKVNQRIARIGTPLFSLSEDPAVLRFIDRALSINNPVLACGAISSAIVILSKCKSTSTIKFKLKEALLTRWSSIDDIDTKLRVGFKAVSVLAEHDLVFAQELAGTLRQNQVSPDDSSRGTFEQCVRLAIRAYAGLLPSRLDSLKDSERLAQLIEVVGSRSSRARLWADLVVRCAGSSRTDDARRIVQSNLRPLLEALRSDNEYDWMGSVANASSALYIANPFDTLNLLDTLPARWKERAFVGLSRYRATGVPNGEPFSKGDRPYQLNYDACSELLELSEHISADHYIYLNIEVVADSATWKHNRAALSQTQKNSLKDKIEALASRKLPSPVGIQHDGYLILSRGQALRLVKSKLSDWDILVQQARQVANMSDRIFVLSNLAKALPNSLDGLRSELMKEAHVLCSQIPASRDRIVKLRMLASFAIGSDNALAKRLLTEAVAFVKASKDTETDEDDVQSIVDLAYQTDPDLAASLASELDGDKGRQEARKRLEFQKLRERMKDPKGMGKVDTKPTGRETATVVWDLLGQLNATGIAARDNADNRAMLSAIRQVSFEDSFPIMSFVIQNAVVRRGHAEEARFFLRDMFEAMVSSCEIARAIILRTAGRTLTSNASSREQGQMLISAGHRGKAMDIIAEWLRTEASEKVYVCDPFFGVKDLEFLQLVLENQPTLQVVIVTSRKQQDQDKISSPYEELYINYWRKNFSDQSPPSTEMVIVGGPSGDLPIHDRWMISKMTGLRLGTSFNGLGVGKDAELTPLTESEVADRTRETLTYIHRDKREHMGQRLSYSFFELP